MKLREYLDTESITAAQFAKRLQVGRTTMYHWLTGSFRPMKKHQLLIQRVTKGKVTTQDWGSDESEEEIANCTGSSRDNGLHTNKRLVANKAKKSKSSKEEKR